MERQYAFSLASSAGERPAPMKCCSTIEPTIFGWKLPTPQSPMMPALQTIKPSQARLGPHGMGQQPAIGAELDSARGSFVACGDPLRRLLEVAQQRHAQQRRQRADQEHRLPMRESQRQELPRGERSEQHADQRRREISPGRQRLQQTRARARGCGRAANRRRARPQDRRLRRHPGRWRSGTRKNRRSPVENELSPVLSEYRRMQIVSIRARPYRSPSAPKIRPPTAHAIRNTDVVYGPYSNASAGSAIRSSMAASRARLKTCRSKQSNAQASEAPAKTSH